MYISPSLEYKDLSEWLSKRANKQTTALIFARHLSKHLNKRQHPVRVRVIPNHTVILDPGQYCFGGEYDPNLDERGRKQFNLEFIITWGKNDLWTMTLDEANEMALELTELLVHEYEHQRQWRKRRYRTHKNRYISELGDYDLRRDQEYLGDPDEIDAYAMNIAARFYLLRHVSNVTSKYPCFDLRRYLRTFGLHHTVSQQLIKKIHTNIEYLRENDNGKTHRRSCKRPRIRRL